MELIVKPRQLGIPAESEGEILETVRYRLMYAPNLFCSIPLV